MVYIKLNKGMVIMLEINSEFIRGNLIIRLKGILDSKTYIKLDDYLYDMIFEQELRYFVLNVDELYYIDNIGLKILIDRYFDIVVHDGKLVICGNDRFNIYSAKLRFNS